MAGVLEGFAVVALVIAVGALVGRLGLLGPHARFVLSRIVYFVLLPALLFSTIAEADVATLFPGTLAVAVISAAVSFALYAGIASGIRRRPFPETVIGTMASGYVNANNIGLPLASYILGNTAATAPVILLQLVVLTPIVLTLLDLGTGSTFSIRTVLLRPISNPIIVASLAGVLVSLAGLQLPGFVLEPFRLVGAAAVPIVLLSFGMSLSGSRPFAPGTPRAEVVLATVLKSVVMPVVGWALARFVFGLSGHVLFTSVVLAALPTAQNVFNYAQRFETGEAVARDVVLVTTVLAVPVLVVVAALLAPG